jgi:hypothetical protein
MFVIVCKVQLSFQFIDLFVCTVYKGYKNNFIFFYTYFDSVLYFSYLNVCVGR